MSQNTPPTFLQGFQPPDLAAQALASVGSGVPPQLSIEGNRFTLVSGGDEEPIATFDAKLGVYVDLVIIDMLAFKSKIFYGGKPYDAKNPTPPLCFSDNGIAPSNQAGNPQATTCASCPQNAIGSAVGMKGQAVRACKDYIKSAVVLPAFPDEVFQLRIPANSFKHLRTYSEWCTKSRVVMQTIVTRVFFEQGIQGTLMFHGIGYLQEEATFRFIQKLLVDKATDGLVGRTDVPRDPAIPLPGAAQLGQAPAHLQQGQPRLVPQPAIGTPAGTAAAYAGQPGFVPQAGPALAPPQQVQLPAGQQAGAVAQQPQPEPPKRRRRTQAQIAADNAAAAPTQTAQPAAVSQPNGFGMAQGAAPPDDMAVQLDMIFGTQP